jgi:hypothetical protein
MKIVCEREKLDRVRFSAIRAIACEQGRWL